MTPDEKARWDQQNKDLTVASGNVEDKRSMVSFLYELMRDHLPPGKVEEIVRHVLAEDYERRYCNGWLAQYAQSVADRLHLDHDFIVEHIGRQGDGHICVMECQTCGLKRVYALKEEICKPNQPAQPGQP